MCVKVKLKVFIVRVTFSPRKGSVTPEPELKIIINKTCVRSYERIIFSIFGYKSQHLLALFTFTVVNEYLILYVIVQERETE